MSLYEVNQVKPQWPHELYIKEFAGMYDKDVFSAINHNLSMYIY